jgi:hypothetical protein
VLYLEPRRSELGDIYVWISSVHRIGASLIVNWIFSQVNMFHTVLYL